jgi:hypothetical protein
MRWAKGYIQVMGKYGTKLVRGIFSKKWSSCFDMSCTILPALVLSILSVIVNIAGAIALAIAGGDLIPLLVGLGDTVASMYALLFVLGLITTITEWKNIHCSTFKKILYAITFPIFMITYVPVTIAALFSKSEWKPIHHDKSKTLDDIMADGAKKDEKKESESDK